MVVVVVVAAAHLMAIASATLMRGFWHNLAGMLALQVGQLSLRCTVVHLVKHSRQKLCWQGACRRGKKGAGGSAQMRTGRQAEQGRWQGACSGGGRRSPPQAAAAAVCSPRQRLAQLRQQDGTAPIEDPTQSPRSYALQADTAACARAPARTTGAAARRPP